MTQKGAIQINQVRGTDHWRSVLTDDDVRLIREAVAERERLRAEANKLSNSALAEKLGCSIRTVDRVTQRSGWVHVQ